MNVLEVGGGELPSYSKKFGNGINIDIRPHELVDIVHDLEKFPYPFEDNTFDLVYSRYAQEHINWRVLRDFLKEEYRILKPGGRVTAICPNLRAQCEIICRTKELDLEQWVCMIFGDNNYDDNSHKSSLSPELAEKLYLEAGFKDFTWYPLPQWSGDMVVQAIK
jgi:ubiquinone/menaquinone biosynthesis C-methylase UbiE